MTRSRPPATRRCSAALLRTVPRYYRYFSTPEFVYHGREMRNHNHLLGQVGGLDGIKTGYTRASGFNLVASVHRDGRYLVAVVLGGRSASERDERMRELIGDHIREATLRHIAPPVAEKSEPHAEPQPPLSRVQTPLPPKVETTSSVATNAQPGEKIALPFCLLAISMSRRNARRSR